MVMHGGAWWCMVVHGGAWPFLVGGVICLVNSDNERRRSHSRSDSAVFGKMPKLEVKSANVSSNQLRFY